MLVWYIVFTCIGVDLCNKYSREVVRSICAYVNGLPKSNRLCGVYVLDALIRRAATIATDKQQRFIQALTQHLTTMWATLVECPSVDIVSNLSHVCDTYIYTVHKYNSTHDLILYMLCMDCMCVSIDWKKFYKVGKLDIHCLMIHWMN